MLLAEESTKGDRAMRLEVRSCLRTLLSGAAVCASIITGGLVIASGASADDDDPITYKGVFTKTGSMVHPRLNSESVVLNDGRVLVFGGQTSFDDPESITNSAEIYDPATNKFTATGSLSRGRRNPQTVLLKDGRVLVAGGDAAKFTDLHPDLTWKSAEIYDPSSGTFSATGNSEGFFSGDTSSILKDGRVLLLGYGYAEIFDPGTGTFSPTGAPVIERKNAAATLLKDGSVLLAGGDSFANYCPSKLGPGGMILNPKNITRRLERSA
ncbi:MAG: hypothetical protein IPK93_03055 [Solirubrobacterales bacterium]|nr:hypothetical protein [Solirubrobacterales bacterium]